MNKNKFINSKTVHFKQWTRKSFGVYSSLGKLVKICSLALSYSLLVLPAKAKNTDQDTIVIQMQDEVDLEEVEITGQRTPAVFSEIGRAISVISKSEIQSSPAQSLEDLLEYAQSIDIRQRNTNGVQADVQMRGGSFDQILILLNGINITDPQTGHFNLNLPVTIDQIERVEILRGGASRVYGTNAYKGVINFITSNEKNNVKASLSYGQHNLFDAGISASLGKSSFSNELSFNHKSSDGYTQSTDYNVNNLYYQARLAHENISNSIALGLTQKAYGANAFYSPRFPDQYEETNSQFVAIKSRYTKKLDVKIDGYWRRHQDHFLLKRDDPSFYENFHRTDIFGANADTYFESELGKTSVGLNFRNEKILSSRLGDDISEPIKINSEDSAYYTKSYSRYYFNGFLEQKVSLGKLNIVGGTLIEINSESDKLQFYPGIDVNYSIYNGLKIYSSINRSMRLPTFTDMFYTDGSNEGTADLKPEKLTSFEGGISYSSPFISTDITYFYDHATDVIDWLWLTDRNLYKATNLSEITTQGIETQVVFSFLNVPILEKITLSYSANDVSKQSKEYESKYVLDHLKNKVGVKSSFLFFENFLLTFYTTYQDRNGTYLVYDAGSGETNTKEFKPYWLSDARLSWTRNYLTLYAEATNLFDVKYIDIGSLTQPGRWLKAGIKINFNFNN